KCGCADKRRGRELETLLDLAPNACREGLRTVRTASYVDDFDGEAHIGIDDGTWPPLVRDEGRPKDFVPAHDLVQRALERGEIDPAVDRERERNVVRRTARRHLVDEPQPLLPPRHLSFRSARSRHDA